MQTKSSHLTAAPNSMSDWSPNPQFLCALGLQHEPRACTAQQQPCSYIARGTEMASSQGLSCLLYLFRLEVKGHPLKLSCWRNFSALQIASALEKSTANWKPVLVPGIPSEAFQHSEIMLREYSRVFFLPMKTLIMLQFSHPQSAAICSCSYAFGR